MIVNRVGVAFQLYQLKEILSAAWCTVFLVSILLFSLSGTHLLSDPDVCWHIASGQLIRNTGSVPLYDIWSYVGKEQQWYNVSWLWDILCSYIYDYTNFIGLSIFQNIVASLIIALLYNTIIARCNITYDAVMITTSLSALTLLDITYCRPQLLAIMITLSFRNLIYKLIYKEKHQIQYKAYIALCILMLVWSNIHGSFPLAFIIIIAYMAEACSALRIKKHSFPKHIILQLITLFIVCIVLTLCNPIGYKIYIGITRTLDSVILPFIKEWQPFALNNSYGLSLLISVLLCASFAYKIRYRVLHITVSDWILGILGLSGTMISLRHAGFFVTIGAPFIAAIIDRALPSPKYQFKINKHITYITNISLIIIVPIVFVIMLYFFPDRKIGLNDTPYLAIEFISKHYPGHKFLNGYDSGGYIIIFGKGHFWHFIDGRAGTVFTEEQLSTAIEMHANPQKWLSILEKHGAHGLIISNGMADKINFSTKQPLKKIYDDKKYTVFIK